MRIGVDLDGVMYPFVSELERWCDTHVPPIARRKTPAMRWEFYRDWGWTGEHFRQVCNEAVDEGRLFWEGEPTPGSLDAIRSLHRAGHKIVVVTARDFGMGKTSENATKFWLRDWQIPFGELHFAQDKTTFDLDVMIDDSVEILRSFSNTTTLPICWHQPWNWEWGGWRASDWSTAMDFIDIVKESKVRDEDVERAVKTGEEWQRHMLRTPDRPATITTRDGDLSWKPRITEQARTDAIPRPPAPPETILQEAQRLVHGDRGNDYGHPVHDFTRTGRMWGAILGIPDVSPHLVGLCMVALKMSREVNKPKRDNRTDMAGYAETVDMIATFAG